jgi:uncharacterized protein YicC (UPF0701 family)
MLFSNCVLARYVLDVNVSQASQAVHAISVLALHLGRHSSQVVDVCVFKLLEFLQETREEDEQLAAKVLDAFRDILQAFPAKAELIILALPRFVLKQVRQIYH